jgi:hypothetical protein
VRPSLIGGAPGQSVDEQVKQQFEALVPVDIGVLTGDGGQVRKLGLRE